MKKALYLGMNLLALIAIGAVIIAAATYCYNTFGDFKALFGSSRAAVLGPAEASRSLAAGSELASKFSLYIFSGIIVIQFVTLYVAVLVIHGIRDTRDSAAIKLKKLANADIFLDLPLYVGLFGSVSSFMVMTFSPSSSQLIAYSSTLIGIIFSTVMRIALLYPLRSKLLSQNPESHK